MGRKVGTTNKSNYHYLVEEYENYHKDKLIKKGYFKTQKDIQDYYGMKNRASVYHTIKNDTTRIKKYNFLNIKKLEPPLPIRKSIVINYSISESEDESIISESITESDIE